MWSLWNSLYKEIWIPKNFLLLHETLVSCCVSVSPTMTLSVMLITTNHSLNTTRGNEDALLNLLCRGKSKMEIYSVLFTQCFPAIKKAFYYLISLDDYHLSCISGSHLEYLSCNIENSKTLADNNLVMKCYTSYLTRKNEKNHTV